MQLPLPDTPHSMKKILTIQTGLLWLSCVIWNLCNMHIQPLYTACFGQDTQEAVSDSLIQYKHNQFLLILCHSNIFLLFTCCFLEECTVYISKFQNVKGIRFWNGCLWKNYEHSIFLLSCCRPLFAESRLRETEFTFDMIDDLMACQNATQTK